MRDLGLAALAFMILSLSAQAQVTLDCEDAANASNDECLALPPAQDATNFAPLIAPVLGGLGLLAGLAAGGGADGGSNTNTTTSTTSTD